MSVYSIGDVARAGGLSVRMLRHYDEIGLLRPARTDSRTGYRSYEPKQLDRLHRILALKDLGFSLAQVRLIVDDDVSAEELRGMLRLRQMELTNEIADTKQRLRRVELHIHSIDQESVMSNTDIIIKHIDEVLVAVVSAMADDFGPDSIGPVLQPLYPQLFERVAGNGLRPTAPPIAFYEDGPAGDGIVVHAAVPVAAPDPGTTLHGVEVRTLAAVEQAVTLVHRGSMAAIETSYSALMRYIGDHGLRTLGYSREVYLDCPENIDDWVTELQFAVAPV